MQSERVCSFPSDTLRIEWFLLAQASSLNPEESLGAGAQTLSLCLQAVLMKKNLERISFVSYKVHDSIMLLRYLLSLKSQGFCELILPKWLALLCWRQISWISSTFFLLKFCFLVLAACSFFSWCHFTWFPIFSISCTPVDFHSQILSFCC